MQRLVACELMDDDTAGTTEECRHSLQDLSRINTYLGGWAALRSEVRQLRPAPRRILDVATGGADLPRRLLDYLRAQGTLARCTVVDRSPRIVGIARELTRERSDIDVVQADARSLPFADRSFDLATLNLALHHFEPPDAAKVLAELARVAKNAIINDLRRSWIAWAFARFAFPFFTRNRFTLADGPVSVRRAYTPAELRELARQAGWQRIKVRTQFGYRMTLAGGQLA